MNSINRLLSLALGLVGCLLGFEVGRPYLECLEAKPEENSVQVRPGEPSVERRLMVLAQRSLAKKRVVEQLAAGRIDLFEAGAWFRWLNETPSDVPTEPIFGWPGAGPEETLCRQVILYVRNETRWLALQSPPEELALRLERQLTSALARPGGLKLPSP
jgi:hypothetical protein